jgi:hypothetical protein
VNLLEGLKDKTGTGEKQLCPVWFPMLCARANEGTDLETEIGRNPFWKEWTTRMVKDPFKIRVKIVRQDLFYCLFLSL